MSLDNKKVLLVGAATGIGLSVLESLLREGAIVTVADKQIDLLIKNTQFLLKMYSNKFECHWLDLAEHTQVAEIVEAWQQQGTFDHLVCCVGLLHVGSLHELPIAAVKHTFDVNTFGVLALMQTVAKSMKFKGLGSMVIVGSNAANTPRQSIGAYGASKAALHMMVKCMGIELSPFGIRCNIVSPGSTDTPMQRQLWTESYGESEVIAGDLSQFRLGIPLAKLAQPQDIANAILFLLSDAAGHITMHDLRVDGGATLDN
ncbi:2,3-dihydro-2,3-dihydroxybenzoate dehydrogenase [Vibrio pectenicida]|uniref:2,3-dihydro-2,3-dihydroxybenzoate dehydrogenase n=1 Tax=Vibrio pectenicida TaxID=62763 RepID=A0A427U1F9_9VIBR|nr:2,3-dihydro-2,3-dihydroxybenzoate dehydrogenase [Vibrio pectenicida]NOH72995.1 2,3-dihydro-2,3-dihydroxybenzoate dehydrogenase [Vibrio pectenicida]RSD30488.1 2,3-dihydro-2,3-dihydroxybenzoate dehydrogenase [Vibrio pectenicida]